MRKFTNEESFLFNAFIRESKKQMYIMSFDENNKITGFKTFQKEKDEGYFFIYGDEGN